MVTITEEQLTREPGEALRQVKAGETVTVTSGDVPVAEIKPIAHGNPAGLRPFGLAKGEFLVPDDFDAELPPEIIEGFEGK